MSSKHTPGPWRQGVDGNARVYGPDEMGEHSGLIAVVYKRRGDARLIAAAPDMLEALRVLDASLAMHGFDTDGTMRSTALAAIAKAEGHE